MPLPPSLAPIQNRQNYFEGTFLQFGEATEHEETSQGIRAIAHVRDKIWVAHEDLSGIAIADVATGRINNVIPVDSPVGLYFFEEMDLMFVSCKSALKQGGKQSGVVFAFSVITYNIFFTYSHPDMVHPTSKNATISCDNSGNIVI
jgi:hypothetical protein